MPNFYTSFARSAERWPRNVALELQAAAGGGGGEEEERYTYGELRERAEAVAAWLRARNMPAGARCAILGANGPRWVAAYLGVMAAGGVAVPLDTAFKPEQVSRLVEDCGAWLIFADARHLLLARPAAEQHSAQLVLLDEDLPASSPQQRLGALRHEPKPEDLRLARLKEIFTTEHSGFAVADAGDDAVAVILYTSGTTSDPKGVMLTHRNLQAESEAVFGFLKIGPSDAILGVLPLFHALAQIANLLLPLAVGARVVYLESLNTGELMRALAERDITLFACVPQFFYLIHERVVREVQARGAAAMLGFRLLLDVCRAGRAVGLNPGKVMFARVHRMLGPRMRYLVTGGSRFDTAIARDLDALGFDILQAYGLTETSGGATCTPPRANVLGSVGKPMPGVEVKIGEASVPIAAEEHAGGRVGEILIRGPIIMRGYWQRAEATAEVLREGWLHSGDLGYVDARGNVFVTGRQKDIIVLSSGKNIYPEEIEAHYQKSPFIKEICVLGIQSAPGEPFAERLHAVIVPDLEALRARKIVNAAEVIRFDVETLSADLASTKRVLSYEIWQHELPRTTTRKLKRFAIEKEVRERRARGGGGTDEKSRRAFSDDDLAWLEEPAVARALEVVRNASKLKRTDLHPDDSLELDLGLDSMERVEMLVALEEALEAHVEDSVVAEVYTVRELVEAVRAGASKARAEFAGWEALLRDVPPEVEAEFKRKRPLSEIFWFMVGRFVQVIASDQFHLRVSGLEKLPKDGPFIICPNHQSFLDAPVVASTFPWSVLKRTFTVGTSEIFGAGLFRALGRSFRLFPIDPDANLVSAMRVGAAGLRHGLVLLLYPEGERSIDGAPKRFKRGAAILAAQLQVPIVPVAIDGFFEAWPRGKPFQKFSRLKVMYGDPIPPPKMTDDPDKVYAAHIALVRVRVLEMWEKLHGGERQVAAD